MHVLSAILTGGWGEVGNVDWHMHELGAPARFLYIDFIEILNIFKFSTFFFWGGGGGGGS